MSTHYCDICNNNIFIHYDLHTSKSLKIQFNMQHYSYCSKKHKKRVGVEVKNHCNLRNEGNNLLKHIKANEDAYLEEVLNDKADFQALMFLNETLPLGSNPITAYDELHDLYSEDHNNHYLETSEFYLSNGEHISKPKESLLTNGNIEPNKVNINYELFQDQLFNLMDTNTKNPWKPGWYPDPILESNIHYSWEDAGRYLLIIHNYV